MSTVQPIRDKEVVAEIASTLRFTSERNYIFFCMGVYSGLRVSDLLTLQVSAVRNQTHISLIEHKTRNTRKKVKKKKFIIHPDLYDDLQRYIEGMEDDEFLFASRQKKTKSGERGQPFNRATAYRMLNKIAKPFGLKEIGCHTLRKTWGYQLLTNAEPDQAPYVLALLMEMFGHSDPMYTFRYLGLTQDAMDTAIRRLSYTKS
ncbi:tyrosine-type recombinase/integrase [Cohnella silvisoli]|uniref:Tyrosine-type recombinase/integrase n=1 Tax=Cohnella silvisoli TaxID=2873699 RepID=A0ABV1L4K4_9BACL|nr:tyrosine-type recombinase/integrase [Cohnella silvisoli]MCD9026035.1 tyrosine-type recombinase/integrase [Cohnella silvisoli]